MHSRPRAPRRPAPGLLTVTLTALSLLAAAPPAPAQDASAGLTGVAIPRQDTLASSPLGFRDGSIVAAPIPLSNPTLGTGLILGAGYLFQADPGSDASFLGVAALRTDNGSIAYGAGLRLSLGDGRWRATAGYGNAALNYALELVPGRDSGTLDIEQKGDIAKLALGYGVTDSLFVGLDARWLRTSVTESTLAAAFDELIPDFGITLEEVAVGPTLEWNTVDDSLYPTSGLAISYAALKGQGLDGFGADFWRQVLDVAAYTPLGERAVLATKATGCRVDGTAPFYDLCSVGLTDGFRGFAFGDLLGPSLLSGQAEVRLRMGSRFGAAIYGGAASVAADFGAMDAGTVRTAGGIGLRYRLSRKFPLDISVDAIVNDARVRSTYVFVGQGF